MPALKQPYSILSDSFSHDCHVSSPVSGRRPYWRLEPADRMSFLIDNQEYFLAARQALLNARKSVFLLGWNFDPRTSLDRGRGADTPDTIGAVLNSLAQERPEVDIRLLIWDASLIVAAGRKFFPQRSPGWLDPRIHFRLDSSHPPGACHHEKILVIDDAVAFCSGGDFRPDRWDRSAHLDDDPDRRAPSGKPYDPRHSAALLVDGSAARSLGELARARLGAGHERKPSCCNCRNGSLARQRRPVVGEAESRDHPHSAGLESNSGHPGIRGSPSESHRSGTEDHLHRESVLLLAGDREGFGRAPGRARWPRNHSDHYLP